VIGRAKGRGQVKMTYNKAAGAKIKNRRK